MSMTNGLGQKKKRPVKDAFCKGGGLVRAAGVSQTCFISIYDLRAGKVPGRAYFLAAAKRLNPTMTNTTFIAQAATNGGTSPDLPRDSMIRSMKM